MSLLIILQIAIFIVLLLNSLFFYTQEIYIMSAFYAFLTLGQTHLIFENNKSKIMDAKKK